jgi:hypothetical protein
VTDVEYEKTDDDEWTYQAYDLALAGDLVCTIVLDAEGVGVAEIDGPCPRCRHRWSGQQQIQEVVEDGERRMIRDVDAKTPIRVDITCQCGVTHGKTPPGRLGCGASYRTHRVLGA